MPVGVPRRAGHARGEHVGERLGLGDRPCHHQHVGFGQRVGRRGRFRRCDGLGRQAARPGDRRQSGACLRWYRGEQTTARLVGIEGDDVTRQVGPGGVVKEACRVRVHAGPFGEDLLVLGGCGQPERCYRVLSDHMRLFLEIEHYTIAAHLAIDRIRATTGRYGPGPGAGAIGCPVRVRRAHWVGSHRTAPCRDRRQGGLYGYSS